MMISGSLDTPESIPGSEETMVTSLGHRLRLLWGWERQEEKRRLGGRCRKRQPHRSIEGWEEKRDAVKEWAQEPPAQHIVLPPAQGLRRDLWYSHLTFLLLHHFLIWKGMGDTQMSGTLEHRMNVYQRLRDQPQPREIRPHPFSHSLGVQAPFLLSQTREPRP